MRLLRKIRLIIAMVVGIPVLLFMGISAIHTYAVGEGRVHVVADETEVDVSIDGVRVGGVAAGTHRSFQVKQGTHRVEITGDGEAQQREVKVSSGFANLLVPASNDQCFVVLDVSNSHYGSGKERPKVSKRIARGEIADLSSSTHYGENELPHSISDKESCELVSTIDCAVLSGEDSAVVMALGY
jgi:hypothetical protein